MPKAYSYARWSSSQQGQGDSLRRQLDLSRKYAAKHALDLDESFRDPGVSAYRGKNRVEGALANFIAQIEAGKVTPGSYLLIESLDRLSREQVLVALELFISIIRRGVKIVTLLDEQLFSQEELNKNIGLLFLSIGIMQRAHEESRTKGERVAIANENKRHRARESSVPMTSLCPGWLRLVGDGRGYEHKRYEIIPERAIVVRRIYLEAVAGLGKRRITARLNRDGIPTFRGKDGWHQSSVGKILSTEAVLGLFQPHRKVNGKRVPDGPPIPGYFPRNNRRGDVLASPGSDQGTPTSSRWPQGRGGHKSVLWYRCMRRMPRWEIASRQQRTTAQGWQISDLSEGEPWVMCEPCALPLRSA